MMPAPACGWTAWKKSVSDQKGKEMDNESREKLRPVLYLAAGAYLIYLAFKMNATLGQSAGTEHTISMVAMLVFGICGAAIFVLGLFVAKKVFFGKSESSLENTEENAAESEQEEKEEEK